MRYPTFQQIINDEVTRFAAKLPLIEGKAGRKPTTRITEVAKEMVVGVGTLTNWINGVAFPRDDQINKLVRFFRPEGGAAADSLLSEIQRAKDVDRAAIHSLQGGEELRVAFLEYSPFSGSLEGNMQTGSLDKVLRRLFQLSERRFHSRPPRTGVDDAEKLLRTGTTHINVCMFDTPDRCVDLHAFHSPARVSLNAVFLSESEDTAREIEKKRQSLADLLAP